MASSLFDIFLLLEKKRFLHNQNFDKEFQVYEPQVPGSAQIKSCQAD